MLGVEAANVTAPCSRTADTPKRVSNCCVARRTPLLKRPHTRVCYRGFPGAEPAPPFSLITGSGSGTRVPRDRSWGANPGQNGRPCSRVAREEGQEGLEVEERECSAEEKTHCGSKRMAPTPPFVLFNHSSIENRSHPLRARGMNTHARW